MSKTHSLIVALLALLALLAAPSCSQFSYDGDLDGQWQLLTIDTPAGETIAIEGRYFCFGSRVVNLTSSTGVKIAGNMVYDKEFQVLTLDFPVEGHWLGSWGLPLHSPCTVTFSVIELTSKRLVLRKPDDSTFTFRKF